MTFYEYECENCGVRFERIQSMQSEPVRICPECSGQVHKIMHAAGIIFKGSGWYITDSKKSTSGAVTGDTKPETTPPSASKPAESAEKSETKTETKSETKTETKSEAKPETASAKK